MSLCKERDKHKLLIFLTCLSSLLLFGIQFLINGNVSKINLGKCKKKKKTCIFHRNIKKASDLRKMVVVIKNELKEYHGIDIYVSVVKYMFQLSSNA